LSAAMQDYPDKRVVLLIDDPSAPGNEKDRLSLAAAHALPLELQKLLDAPAAEFAVLRDAFVSRQNEADFSLLSETLGLADAYDLAAKWFKQQCRDLSGPTHSDELFITQSFSEPAAEFRRRANALRNAAENGGPYPSKSEILVEYQRLVARFRVKLTSF